MKRKKDETITETDQIEVSQSDAETTATNESDHPGDASNVGNFAEYFNGPDVPPEEQSAEKPEAEHVDVEAILQEYAPKQKRGRKKKEDTPPPVEPIISGELFIEMIDAGAVSVIGIVDSYLSKNPIDAQLLSLRQEQKDKLKLLADRAVIELQKKIEVNPLAAFGVAIGSMYLMNYVMIRSLMNANKKTEV